MGIRVGLDVKCWVTQVQVKERWKTKLTFKEGAAAISLLRKQMKIGTLVRAANESLSS